MSWHYAGSVVAFCVGAALLISFCAATCGVVYFGVPLK